MESFLWVSHEGTPVIPPVEHTAKTDTDVLDDVTCAEGTLLADSGNLGWLHISVPPEMFPVERVTTAGAHMLLDGSGH